MDSNVGDIDYTIVRNKLVIAELSPSQAAVHFRTRSATRSFQARRPAADGD